MREFAILCPRQGLQSATMFDLVAGSAEGRAVLDAFSATLASDLVARARSNDDLFDNRYAQPALVAVALATWRALAPRLPRPALFAGYSIGELSAWACAGAWPVPVCATLAETRADTMERAAPAGTSGMLAVRGLSIGAVTRLADDVPIAIVNAADHVVLAGPRARLDVLVAGMEAHGASTRSLDVTVPSHTPVLRAASERFATTLAAHPAIDVDAPVVRGVDGVPLGRGGEAADALARAISEPIRWDACRRTLDERGIRVALELGPGRSLSAMWNDGANGIDSGLVVRSVDDFRTLAGVEQWLLRQLDD